MKDILAVNANIKKKKDLKYLTVHFTAQQIKPKTSRRKEKIKSRVNKIEK